MITLADTSVWIDHFRKGNQWFAERLSDGLIITHPFVIGELACGNFKNRRAILADLRALDSARPATHAETMYLIENHGLWRRGLGWVDMHLLASALISGCLLWTLDKRLAGTATELGVMAAV